MQQTPINDPKNPGGCLRSALSGYPMNMGF